VLSIAKLKFKSCYVVCRKFKNIERTVENLFTSIKICAQIKFISNLLLFVDEKLDCSVCMDSFQLNDSAKQLPCEHFFHIPCIDPWLILVSLLFSVFQLRWWWCYPTPSAEWECRGTPRKPNSRASPQGLDQRSKMDEVVPKMARRRGSDAGQSRRR